MLRPSFSSLSVFVQLNLRPGGRRATMAARNVNGSLDLLYYDRLTLGPFRAVEQIVGDPVPGPS
jgi:hypothetical protein